MIFSRTNSYIFASYKLFESIAFSENDPCTIQASKKLIRNIFSILFLMNELHLSLIQ